MHRPLACVGMLLLSALPAVAQQPAPLAPLPVEQQRITPAQPSPADQNILTTRPPAAPFANQQAAPAAPGQYKPTVPFGRADASWNTPAPAGPRSVTAVPVENVDAIETAAPAPPTPMAPEFDPAQENPTEPTELSSPIFEAETGEVAPRVLVLRALNKVTAQAKNLSLAPGQATRFGQLEIRALRCQQSIPSSQPDHAGYLVIRELQPDGVSPKLIYQGWMYASSPSIAAIEHPIYDVTLVECKLATPKAKEAEEEKPAKKKSKKGR
jgi:hypothetical protein